MSSNKHSWVSKKMIDYTQLQVCASDLQMFCTTALKHDCCWLVAWVKLCFWAHPIHEITAWCSSHLHSLIFYWDEICQLTRTCRHAHQAIYHKQWHLTRCTKSGKRVSLKKAPEDLSLSMTRSVPAGVASSSSWPEMMGRQRWRERERA